MAEVSAEKLVARLTSGKPVPAIVLLGTDAYLSDLCRNQIIEACVPEAARDWAVARIRGDAQGWDEALERVQTMPMLAPRQVIIVEDAQQIEKLGDESRDVIIKALSEYFASPAPFSVLLIEAAALDRRQKFFKLLDDRALLVELTIGPESAAGLATQMGKELKIEIDSAAASLLAESLNFEPARIHMEIDKLAAYAHERGRITTADVEALVKAARKNTVWQLADMLAVKQRAKALEFFDNLWREGEDPIRMIGALAFRYRKLVEARGLPRTMNGYQAARQLGMNSNDAESAIRNAHRVSKADLLAGLIALADADSQLKSSNPEPRAFMEFLIARLASPATPASAA